MRRLYAGFAGALLLASFSCISDRAEVTAPVDNAGCTIPGNAVGPDRVAVLIRGFAFLPDTIHVRRGTTVTWVNCETETVEAHTSTSEEGAWESNLIGPGAAYSHTFHGQGTFPYFCRPHPFMRAAIIVE